MIKWVLLVRGQKPGQLVCYLQITEYDKMGELKPYSLPFCPFVSGHPASTIKTGDNVGEMIKKQGTKADHLFSKGQTCHQNKPDSDAHTIHPTPYLLHVGAVQLQPEISNDGIVGLEGLVRCSLSVVQVLPGLLQRRHLLLQPAHLILQVLSLWLPLQANIQLLHPGKKRRELSNAVRPIAVCMFSCCSFKPKSISVMPFHFVFICFFVVIFSWRWNILSSDCLCRPFSKKIKIMVTVKSNFLSQTYGPSKK